MNENEARQTLLIRAFETAPPSPQWDDADREWATVSAAQIEGENAPGDRFIARRAALASERLAHRVPLVARQLAALQWRPWLLTALAGVALLAGLLVDAIGAGQRINILAPPILAVLLWNLAVYLLLAGNGLRRLFFNRNATAAPTATTAAVTAPGPGNGRPPLPTDEAREAGRPGANWLIRWLAERMAGLPRRRRHDRGANNRTPLAAFTRHWAVASSALYSTRSMAGLHLAAAMLALGMLASLYLRGLAFEFLAGWESTFLTASSVATLIGTVLGPASLLSGIALPDIARLEAIRFPASAGENAGPWIHLYAITLLIAVVLPRLALTGVEAWKARRLARDFPVPLTEPYFLDLLRQYRGEAAIVQVLPYSYQVPVDSVRALNRVMHLVYGPATTVTVAPSVQLGAEDRLRDTAHPESVATLSIALFTLTATPEIENHAAFVNALRQILPPGAPLLALVDEAAFRSRFGAASERLVTRRSAWRRILQDGAHIEPVFVALGMDEPSELKSRLGEVLRQSTDGMVQNSGVAADARITA